MSGYRLAAPHGAWLSRSQPVRFAFNGRSVDGFAGDTVASALLAQGIGFVGRSFKLHRPRGIFSCGVEEPIGLVDVGQGAGRSANTRATDILARDGLVAASGNCWPSLEFDLAAINSRLAAFLPAGFYYKTFMWPNWHLFEPVIRRMAGLGVAGSGPDPERYDEVSVNTEVLVIGAGLAGMQVALSAARAGRQVMLLEADVQEGGWIVSQTLRPDSNAVALLDETRRALAQAGVVVQPRTTAVALYDHRLVTAIETFEGSLAPAVIRERLWKIRAKQIVLATGCFGVAQSLVAAGMQVAAIVDRRSASALGPHVRAPAGVQVLHESAIIGVSGTRAVQAVQVAGTAGGGLQTLAADVVASAGGFTPNVNLYSQAGGTLTWIESESMFVPERQLPGVAVVGACAGVFDLDAALAHAEAVGRMAPGDAIPEAPYGGVGQVPADNQPTAAALAARGKSAAKQFVDLQNDVTSADVLLAARENYRSVEHLKRYTTMGMATDQGKTSNVNALVLMGKATDRAPQQVGTTRFRPPFKPVTINALVAGRTGERYRPLKRLSARSFHAARGALFEEFGGWERPAAYLLPGEDLEQAAERETLELRRGVGLFDGSPLGKIEVVGPDAAAFLDLMYVGTMSTLPIGGARYGVLLNENGIVFDDGIVARLAPDHFWVNTTSGGADRVVSAFEEWLQCEYTQLRVFIVSMTSQWGNVTVSGPNAWRLLEKAGFDAALAPSAMKHMTLQEASVHGYAIRVLRASYNGELGYEINLPASHTEAMLEQLWVEGQDMQVCVYGIEALMIMRTEKGFIHVGADTDGTTLPADVGMARGVDRKAANFVGRRSLSRPAGCDPDRLQLVGLLPVDRKTRLPVGAHLSLSKPPTAAEGLVTSSCFSPALQQPVALAMVKRGSQRFGERLQAWYLGKMIEAEVVRTPFYDPSGERLHG